MTRRRAVGASLRGLIAGLALLLASPAPAAAPTLVTPAQIAREREALRILASPAMRAAIARTEARYAADPQAATPAGRARLRHAARAIAASAAHYALGLARDPATPQLFWCCKAAQRIGAVRAPASGYGIDNPDNVYRITHLDGRARYVIEGWMRPDRPAQLHVEVRDAIPGTTALNAEGGGQVATLRDDEMRIAADGRFVITADSDPAGDRPNHLRLPPEGVFHVVVRDLLTDWSTQSAVPLVIRRVGGAAAAPPSEAAIARTAADLLDRIGPYWLDYDNRFLFSRPANRFAEPRLRPGGRGISASAHFVLRAGEALVITADPLGAASLGAQITDPWGVAYDYIARTSSLNIRQAAPNADGTISWVIAARDPGFVNWLDPGGQPNGIVTLRWQGLPPGASPAAALRSVAVVSVDSLRAALGDRGDGMWIDAAARRAQQAQRQRDHLRRRGGD